MKDSGKKVTEDMRAVGGFDFRFDSNKNLEAIRYFLNGGLTELLMKAQEKFGSGAVVVVREVVVKKTPLVPVDNKDYTTFVSKLNELLN